MSDLHISHEKKNFIETYSEKLYSSITAKCPKGSSIVFLITGDIVNKGIENSYELAVQFINSLTENLSSEKYIFHFVTIPGNHDCNFSKEDKVRSLLLNNLEASINVIDDSIIDNVTNIQTGYFKFRDSLNNNIEGNKVFWTQKFKVNNLDFVFNCFNTAWSSTIDESKTKYGNMYFPIDYLKLDTGVITVSLMHHPLNWFSETNKRSIKQYLEKNSDMIVTGHEHDLDIGLRETPNAQTFYSAGKNSFDDYGNLRFTLYSISIDVNGNKSISSSFFNRDKFEDETNYSSIKDNNYKKYKYSLNPLIYESLNKLTSKIIHSEKDDLSLNEIFVAPEFKVNLSAEETDENSEAISHIINFSKLVEELGKGGVNLILGSQYYGKTTVGKRIFHNMLDQGKVVLSISYDDLKVNSVDSSISFINKLCKHSYNDIGIEAIPKEDRILIIDDIDLITCKVYKLIEIVNALKTKFYSIILLGDENLSLATMQIKEAVENIYEMKKFSKRQNMNLVKNWVNTFKSDTLAERENRIRKLFKLVNQALDIGLIPNNPFYVTIYLAQINALGEKIDSITSCAQLVERMIQNYHSSITYKDIDNSGVLNFLQELAWRTFEIDERKLSVKEFKSFVDSYCRGYGLKVSSDEILEIFIFKKVLKMSFDEIKFSEDYFLHYYTAKHLARNYSNEPRVKNDIQKLVDSCYRNDYSNVLLFLSYLMEDRLVFNLVRTKANDLLKNNKLNDLKVDLKNYLQDVPEILSKHGKNEEIQLSHDEIAASTEDRQKDGDELEAYQKSVNNFEFAVSYRCVQLLGAMLQNSSTKILHKEKLEILRDNINLASRIIDNFIDLHMEVQVFEAAKILKNILKRKNKDLNDQDFNQRTKSLIVRIMQVVVVNVIERISNHSANRTLLPVFDEILDRNNYLHNVIDLQLELDHHEEHVTLSKVTDYSKKFSNNVFLNGICKDIVRRFLQITSEEIHIKQSIAAAFEIPYKNIPISTSTNLDKKDK